MKIAMAQMRMSENMDENLQKTIRLIREAGSQGADLVLFPEIQHTPFFPQYEGRDVSEYVLKEEDPMVQAVCRAGETQHLQGHAEKILAPAGVGVLGRCGDAAAEMYQIGFGKSLHSGPSFSLWCFTLCRRGA